jgi:hypothetical protein
MKAICYCIYWLVIFGVTLRVLLKIENNTRPPLRDNARAQGSLSARDLKDLEDLYR